jgi:hypothetical protein
MCVCVHARSRPAVRPAFALLLPLCLKISFGELGFFVSSCFQAQQPFVTGSFRDGTLCDGTFCDGSFRDGTFCIKFYAF